MSHVPDELLAAFADGEVDETLAIHIADHIDGCAACLARAVAREPLADVFAEVSDPQVPEGLVAAVLARAESPLPEPAPLPEPVVAVALAPIAEEPHLPWVEIALGLGLLGAAASISLVADPNARAIATDPEAVLTRVAALMGLIGSAGRALQIGLGATEIGLTLAAAMTLFGLFVTARLATELPLEEGGVA